jgi:hypothetical protein
MNVRYVLVGGVPFWRRTEIQVSQIRAGVVYGG